MIKRLKWNRDFYRRYQESVLVAFYILSHKHRCWYSPCSTTGHLHLKINSLELRMNPACERRVMMKRWYSFKIVKIMFLPCAYNLWRPVAFMVAHYIPWLQALQEYYSTHPRALKGRLLRPVTLISVSGVLLILTTGQDWLW